MKSASNFWIFLILTTLLFNCATRKPEPKALPMQKAYVLLRTEGSEKEINELTNVLNSNFVTNKIASDINYYASGRTWNINQIFTTAYNNNYDYIVLIDQVAKFTIDEKTNVGGKYQIRSYHVKSSNPDWVDLGQKTCNVSVRQSIDKFSQQIISEIVPNYVAPEVAFNLDDQNSEKRQTGISAVDYNQLKSTEKMDDEIVELRKELEKEKKRTNKAVTEKEKLEKEYEKELNFQKEKNKTIKEGLETQKKKKELEEIKRQEEIKLAEIKKKEEQAIVKAKKLERNRIEDERLVEVKKEEEEPRLNELDKKTLKKEKSITVELKKSTSLKDKSKSAEVPSNKSNALIIIRGQDENNNLYKDLQDNIESELLFANIKASTQILNTENTFDKTNVLNWNKSEYEYLILINQLGNKENGESIFKISIHSDKTNSDWKDLNEKSYDLSKRTSLKELSKKVLKSL